MSTTEELTPSPPAEANEFNYRPVSTAAIASVVLAVLSLVIFVAGRDSFEAALMLSPVPIVGLLMGLRAWSRVRAHPDQYTGHKMAALGALLSAACLIGGLAYSGYVFATEVPDGYARTSFEELRPDEVDLRGDKLVPDDVMALNGKKVFIKGYFRPDSSRYRQNVENFLLVRDNNQCCFGDLTTVKYFDQIAVDTKGKVTVDYSPRVFRMGGVLRITPENAFKGPSAPVFALEADFAQ